MGEVPTRYIMRNGGSGLLAMTGGGNKLSLYKVGNELCKRGNLACGRRCCEIASDFPTCEKMIASDWPTCETTTGEKVVVRYG